MVTTGVEERLGRLRAAMRERSVDLLALAPSDSLRYALGFSPIPDERVCILLVSQGQIALVMPALNADQAAHAAPGLKMFTWTDGAGAAQALREGLASTGGAPGRVAVDPEMRADVLLVLQGWLPGAEHVSADDVLSAVRMVKSPDELELLAASARTADDAILSALAACRAGATEFDVSNGGWTSFREAGVDVTFVLVASGPNGAFPHHHTSDRVLEEGDAVVIDLGGRLNGYCSDITRMAHVGEPSVRYREIHGIVESAVVAGMAAARAGVPAGEVDRAARAVIEAAGYGEYFVHRTGHGLGLSTHEMPYLRSDAPDVLEVGNVVSIEPGIYLPGEFGVRLEEIVHLTPDGARRFSRLPRDVRAI